MGEHLQRRVEDALGCYRDGKLDMLPIQHSQLLAGEDFVCLGTGPLEVGSQSNPINDGFTRGCFLVT
jgi:hypothetical protein